MLQGTLDLIVLRALLTMGPMHAYGLAARLDQVADHPFPLNQGTLYAALVRLDQNGWIKGSWQTTQAGREAKSGDRMQVVSAIRREVLALDRDVAVLEPTTLEQEIQRAFAAARPAHHEPAARPEDLRSTDQCRRRAEAEVTPGILTDIAGFLCLVPATRRAIRVRLSRAFSRAAGRGMVTVDAPFVDWREPRDHPFTGRSSTTEANAPID